MLAYASDSSKMSLIEEPFTVWHIESRAEGMTRMIESSRQRAYRAGAKITRDRMAREAPDHARALGAVEAADIVVVPGSYDHVEQVLDALSLPYTTVAPHALGGAALRPHQLLVVNCPGHIDDAAVATVREFVAAGGSLFTTDWALANVVERAFPGVIAYNQRPTGDDVVRIEVGAHDNPFLDGVMEPGDEPLWWLEGSSYPIRILDPGRVEVLITSAELGLRYGEAPVAVLFRHGQGDVFHMISHYFLQRTELRGARQQAPAATYAVAKGVTPTVAMAADLDGLAAGDVESAASSTRWLANVVADKKRRSMTGAGKDSA